MRQKFVCGNWKMNGTIEETRKLLFQLNVEWSKTCENIEVAVCPPFTSLLIAKHELEFAKIKFGAQNCHWQDKGAFTGEISAVMLAELDCTYVIVGHSERRTLFGETNETVAKKAAAVIQAGMLPIICVGETEKEREANQTEAVLRAQIEGSLATITNENCSKMVIAYEPVWAIGTGKNATPAQAQEAHAFIRSELKMRYGNAADSIQILYGGSLKPENADAIFAQPDVDGGLIGGASLDAGSFVRIIESAAETRA